MLTGWVIAEKQLSGKFSFVLVFFCIFLIFRDKHGYFYNLRESCLSYLIWGQFLQLAQSISALPRVHSQAPLHCRPPHQAAAKARLSQDRPHSNYSDSNTDSRPLAGIPTTSRDKPTSLAFPPTEISRTTQCDLISVELKKPPPPVRTLPSYPGQPMVLAGPTPGCRSEEETCSLSPSAPTSDREWQGQKFRRHQGPSARARALKQGHSPTLASPMVYVFPEPV